VTGINAPASISLCLAFLQKNALYWRNVPNASTRFTDWKKTGSTIRYGIQVIGWQVRPDFPTLSPSRECAYQVLVLFVPQML
jgi:hypothetical protein